MTPSRSRIREPIPSKDIWEKGNSPILAQSCGGERGEGRRDDAIGKLAALRTVYLKLGVGNMIWVLQQIWEYKDGRKIFGVYGLTTRRNSDANSQSVVTTLQLRGGLRIHLRLGAIKRGIPCIQQLKREVQG